MTQHATQIHNTKALISHLACLMDESADLQIRQARFQAQIAKIIRDLTNSAALPEVAAAMAKSARPFGLPTAEIAAALARITTPTMEAAARDLMVPRREPDVLSEGLVQDGGKLTAPTVTKDDILNEWAASTLTRSEIAEKLNVPVGRVKKTLAAARTANDQRVHTGAAQRPQFHRVKQPESEVEERRDLILNRYANSTDSYKKIGDDLGVGKNVVFRIMTEERAAKEPRVVQGDKARNYLKETGPAAEAAPPPASTPAKPAASPQEPAQPVPAPEAPKPDKKDPLTAESVARINPPLIVCDTSTGLIHGPTGDWHCNRAVAKTFAAIADGQLYGLDRLARAGGWANDKTVLASLNMWTKELCKIGVEMRHVPGIGVKLNAVEASA